MGRGDEMWGRDAEMWETDDGQEDDEMWGPGGPMRASRVAAQERRAASISGVMPSSS